MSSGDPCAPQSHEELCRSLEDYILEVPGLPIRFVARLPAILRDWGPEFSELDTDRAWIRAASTLAQMGLVRGLVFQFIRIGIGWSQAQAASFVGVSTATVQSWENETTELPVTAWMALVVKIGEMDFPRWTYVAPAPCPGPEYQARLIRIYPDLLQPPMPVIPGPPC